MLEIMSNVPSDFLELKELRPRTSIFYDIKQYERLDNDNNVETKFDAHPPECDEFYIQTFHALVHPPQIKDDNLISHLQKVFNIDKDKHTKLLLDGNHKEISSFELVLNLEIVEAKCLKGKNINGLSNPFCSIYISSRAHLKENTTTKSETLSPIWHEHFSFPVSCVQDDILCIDVMHRNHPDEMAKVKKKGKQGLKLFMKGIALAASSGTWNAHDKIGCLKLPLKNVPSKGIDSWFPLESKKGNGSKSKGEIHLKMDLGTNKDKEDAANVYQQVLYLMVSYEISAQNFGNHKWSGDLSNKLSEIILQKLELKGGLKKKDVDLAKWLAYTRVHCEQCSLDTEIFPLLLQTILQHVNSQLLKENELQMFWRSAETLVENFVTNFRKVHDDKYDSLGNNTNEKSQIFYMQKTMELLKTHSKAVKLDTGNNIKCPITPDLIMQRARNLAISRANEFFNAIAPLNLNCETSRINHMIKMAKLLFADLEKSRDMFESLDGEYFRITYLVYDKRFFELAKPIVCQTCSSLKPLHLIKEEDDYECCQDDYITVGVTLFKLYLELKQFAGLSTNVEDKTTTFTTNEFHIGSKYHTWFHNAVITQWLEIAKFKAMKCIRAAVHHDFLQPLHPTSKITSSALDIAAILQSIEIWNLLSWENLEEPSSFVIKIIEDLDQCVSYYADLIYKKVGQLENSSHDDEIYYINDQLCLAINNIQRLGNELKPIIENIGIKSVVRRVSVTAGNQKLVEKPYKITLVTAALERVAQHIKNNILSILEKVGLKVYYSIQKLLTEAAEASTNEKCTEYIVMYLNHNLTTLKTKLNTSATFDMMFEILWRNLLLTLQYLITTNIEKGRIPAFFKGIQNIFEAVRSIFNPEGSEIPDAISKFSYIQQEIEALLETNGAETTELILKYFLERYKTQSELKMSKKSSDFGLLTVRAYFCEDIKTLRVEVLNARNIKPRGSNGTRDAYVKINIATGDNLPSAKAVCKTKTQWKTLLPWFDERFSVQMEMPNAVTSPIKGILIFTLKDYGKFGTSEFIGDSFLSLNSIPITTSSERFEDLPQIMLPLTLPNKEEFSSRVFRTLERRVWDKSALEFVTRERCKST